MTKVRYNIGNEKGLVNHFMHIFNSKLYVKNINQLDTLINTMKVFVEDTSVEFDIRKCRITKMKKRKYKHSEGIKLPKNEHIKEIYIAKGFKHLGVQNKYVVLDQAM